MNIVNNEKLYLQLIDAYKSAFPEKNGKVVQLDVSKLWKEMKQNKGSELSELAKKKIQELNKITMKNKSRLFDIFSKASKVSLVKKDVTSEITSEISTNSKVQVTSSSNPQQVKVDRPLQEDDDHELLSSKYPAQTKVQEKIIKLESEVNVLLRKNNLGLLNLADKRILKEKERELNDLSKKLKQLKSAAERKKKITKWEKKVNGGSND